MRLAAAAMAEARPSFCQTPAGAASTIATAGRGGPASWIRPSPGRHSRHRQPAHRAAVPLVVFRRLRLTMPGLPLEPTRLAHLDCPSILARNRPASLLRQRAKQMSAAMQELLAILDLEKLEHNLYRGRSPQGGLAARVRRPDHRPGAGRRPADRRARPPCPFAARLFHAAGRHRRCRSSTRSTASATAAASPPAAWWRSSTARRFFRWRPRSRWMKTGSTTSSRCRWTCRRPRRCKSQRELAGGSRRARVRKASAASGRASGRSS